MAEPEDSALWGGCTRLGRARPPSGDREAEKGLAWAPGSRPQDPPSRGGKAAEALGGLLRSPSPPHPRPPQDHDPRRHADPQPAQAAAVTHSALALPSEPTPFRGSARPNLETAQTFLPPCPRDKPPPPLPGVGRDVTSTRSHRTQEAMASINLKRDNEMSSKSPTSLRQRHPRARERVHSPRAGRRWGQVPTVTLTPRNRETASAQPPPHVKHEHMKQQPW